MTLKSWPLWLRLVLVICLGFVTVFDSAKVMNTKTLIKLEELAFVVLSFYLFLALDYAWWWFPLLFFVPDISMIGYVIAPKGRCDHL